jgi:gluconate 5-dehydrogenase
MDVGTMTVLNSFSLAGRRALITGSSGGIGFALAHAMGTAGAHVILNGRNPAKLQAAVQALQDQGLSVSSLSFDVTDAASVRQGIDQIEAEGAIDILINNAGMTIRAPLHEYRTKTGTSSCGPTWTACTLWARPWRSR